MITPPVYLTPTQSLFILPGLGLATPLSLLGQSAWSVRLLDIGTFSSPRVSDLHGDGIPEVVAISVAGDVLAFEGEHLETLWNTTLPDTEAYGFLGSIHGKRLQRPFSQMKPKPST